MYPYDGLDYRHALILALNLIAIELYYAGDWQHSPIVELPS
jgi:hypothetical protein